MNRSPEQLPVRRLSSLDETGNSMKARSTLRQLFVSCTLLATTTCVGFAQDAAPKSEVPPDNIRDLKLRDWNPRSMLKTKVTRVNTPKFSVIDVHNHLGGGAKTLTKERVKRYLREMDDARIRTVVNLDGGWDDKLKETVATLDEAHPG
jgi:hypothetical protein